MGNLPPTTVVDRPLAAGARASDDVMRGARLLSNPSPDRRDTPLEVRCRLASPAIKDVHPAADPLHQCIPMMICLHQSAGMCSRCLPCMVDAVAHDDGIRK